MKKFLRTIRFDETDSNVYEIAAQAGEWAVSGAFSFVDLKPAKIKGKTKQAFANGFLGIESWGRSTFAVVSEHKEADREDIEQKLAHHFVKNFGAPDIEAALPAVRHEALFAQELCEDQPVNTVFMVRRKFDALEQVHEEFRIVRTEEEPTHARIWSVVEDDA